MPTKLGQNFLRDEIVLEKIIQTSNPQEADFVLEIGPGEGVLTEKLAPSSKKVIAVELDDKLIAPLQEKFSAFSNIEIIHGDILKINLPELIANQKLPASTRGDSPRFEEISHRVEAGDRSSTRGGQTTRLASRRQPLVESRRANYKLIANIPYYITSPIIRLFLEQEAQPQEMILMIQKEVAQRIVAHKGQMSILAVSVGYYATAEILFPVGKECFSPAPKVDSAVIKIVPIRKYDKTADKKFFRIVKAGFSAKRKTLLNNLSVSLQIKKEVVEKILTSNSFDIHTRAQELDVSDWERLASSSGLRL